MLDKRFFYFNSVFFSRLIHRKLLLVIVLLCSGCSVLIIADSEVVDLNCEISNYTSVSSLEKCSNNTQTIRIRNSKLRVIPNEIFQGFPFLDFLDLAKSAIQTMDGVHFSKKQNITNLQLYANELKAIPANVFINLTKLHTLSLAQNNITLIDRNAFTGLYDLMLLDLADNQLRSLEENVFRSLIKLHDLRLTSNKLEVIDPDLFSKTTSLHSLYLNYNAIIAIEKQSFWSLKDLKTIDISYNPLSEVDFSHLLKIRVISVNNASLSSFTIPESLRELIASNNKISRLFVPEFTLLSTLNLYNNSFKDFYNISGLSNVQVVDLSYNGITSINISRLSNMKNLQNFVLTGNRLTELNVSSICTYLPKLGAISLTTEQWNQTYVTELSKNLSESHVYIFTAGGVINNVPTASWPAIKNLTIKLAENDKKIQQKAESMPINEADSEFKFELARLADRIAKLESTSSTQKFDQNNENLPMNQNYKNTVDDIRSVKIMFMLILSMFCVYIVVQGAWFLKKKYFPEGLRRQILLNGRARSSDSVNPMFEEGL